MARTRKKVDGAQLSSTESVETPAFDMSDPSGWELDLPDLATGGPLGDLLPSVDGSELGLDFLIGEEGGASTQPPTHPDSYELFAPDSFDTAPDPTSGDGLGGLDLGELVRDTLLAALPEAAGEEGGEEEGLPLNEVLASLDGFSAEGLEGLPTPSLEDLVAVARTEIKEQEAVRSGDHAIASGVDPARIDRTFSLELGERMSAEDGPGQFVLIAGPPKWLDRAIPLGKGRVEIGRDPGADLVIHDRNLAVSVAHARIEFADFRYVLTDLGSTCGTYVNGAMVSERILLHGDRIALGPAVFEFQHVATLEREARARRSSDGLSYGVSREVASQRAPDALFKSQWISTVHTCQEIFQRATVRKLFGHRVADTPLLWKRETFGLWHDKLVVVLEEISEMCATIPEWKRALAWSRDDMSCHCHETCWHVWMARAMADNAVSPGLLLTILGYADWDRYKALWSLGIVPPRAGSQKRLYELVWAFALLQALEAEHLLAPTLMEENGELMLILEIDANGRQKSLTNAALFYEPEANPFAPPSHHALATIRHHSKGIAVGRKCGSRGGVLKVSYAFAIRRLGE